MMNDISSTPAESTDEQIPTDDSLAPAWNYEKELPDGAAGHALEKEILERAPSIPSWEAESCWKFEEWPQRSHWDDRGKPLPEDEEGIDLVAERTDGSAVAIQCKRRKGARSGLSPTDLQKFSGAAEHPAFAEKWLVLRGHRRSSTSKAAKQYGIVLKDWDSALDEASHMAQAFSEDDPRFAAQREAIEKCVSVLRQGCPELADKWTRVDERADWMPETASRAKLVMPCGTGKTRVSAEVVLSLCDGEDDLAVILVPSIALVSQIRREYLSVLQHAKRSARTLAVCSDKTAGHMKASSVWNENRDPTLDEGQVHEADADCRCVSDPAEIAAWLREGKPGLRIIFSTYQSSHHTSEALLRSQKPVQVMVMDEAHRTAQLRPAKTEQREERLRHFIMCHDQLRFPARYRLYQTATPRVYTHKDTEKVRERHKRKGVKWVVDDMHDGAVFGPTAYRLTYKSAVQDGLLTDYKVIGVQAAASTWDAAGKIVRRMARKGSKSGDGNQTGVLQSDTASWLVFAQALAGHVEGTNRPLARHLVFHNRVKDSKKMADTLGDSHVRDIVREMIESQGGGGGGSDGNGNKPVAMRPYSIHHLDASHAVAARRAALRKLAASKAEQPCALTNVGIFGEGVDSPNLDAVAILSPRSSPVEIIQIVGRVMRLSEQKSLGYVIVPLLLERNADVECSLAQTETDEAWSNLGKTLQALRSHDGRIEDDIASMLEIHVPVIHERRKQLVVVLDDPYRDDCKVAVYDGSQERLAQFALGEALEKKILPNWSSTCGKVEDYLTEAKGFRWLATERVQDEQSGRMVIRLPELPDGGQSILKDHPHVLGVKRAVDSTTWACFPSISQSTGVPDAPRTLEDVRYKVHEAPFLGENVEEFRKMRQSLDPSATSPVQPRLPLLPDAWKVTVMQRSGLQGNAERDYNLLMDPMRRGSDLLRGENLEKKLRGALGREHLQDAKQKASACDVAALLLLNALILHARLESREGRPAELLREAKGSLRYVQCASDPCVTLSGAWSAVLKHDYRPMFEPALDLLLVLARSDAIGGASQAIRAMAEWAEANAEHYASMGMEYAGELFSRVMGGQASDGAFFTRTHSARLMAELTLDEMEPIEWDNHREWRKLAVLDPACGSGTLLNAWLESARARVRAASDGNGGLVQAFHKYAVENLITGLDINPISLQLAAGRLVLGNLDVNYRKMRLYPMPYGHLNGGKDSIGSLELLAEESVTGAGAPALPGMAESQVSLDAVEDSTQRSMVLMNPPFTGRKARYEAFPKAARKAMFARETEVREKLAAVDADAARLTTQGSISTFFTPLAEKVLMPGSGVLCKLLPTMGCLSTSGVGERKFFAERFQVKAVLTCHNPKSSSFSQDSEGNESILLCTRPSENTERATTRFLNLREAPRSEDAVQRVIEAIREERFEAIGSVCEWPYERMLAGDWSPVQWYDPQLAHAAYEMRDMPNLSRLGDLFEMGALGRQVRSVFQPGDGDGAVNVFDRPTRSLRQSMRSEPDATWFPKPNKRGSTAWQACLDRRGWCLLASSGGRPSGLRVLSVCHSKKHFGNYYDPVITGTYEEAMGLCALWNSTPALLQLLNMRGGFFTDVDWNTKIKRGIQLPAVLRDSSGIQQAQAAYEALSRETMLPLRELAECAVRARLDEAVAELWGIDAERLADWRRRIAAEPMVCSRKAV